MGYPIHADLQGPTWHLESLIASLWGTQGAHYVHYALLGYIYIGGVGMYKLSSLFTDKKWILFLAGAAYVCSGFFTSHTMHLFAIISGAFIPLIIYHFIQMFRKMSWVHAIWAAVFVFFNLTGGNQTFTIISFYLLLIVTVHYAVKAWKEGKTSRLSFLKIGLIFGSTSIAMGSVMFTVFLQVKPYLSRLSHLDYKAASLFPFPPAASTSFVNPMATINDKVALETDGSMANAYFGILFITFFLLVFGMKRKNWLDYTFLGFGIFALIASFGDHTPLHHFLYEYFPLLGKFRFPSYYIYFFLLCAIPLSAKALDQFVSGEKEWKLSWIYPVLILSLIATLTIVGLISMDGEAFFTLDGVWFDKLRQSTFAQNVFYYGLIQLPLAAAIFWFVWKKKIRWIIGLVVLDCIIAAQPNLLYIGVGKTKPADIEQSLAEYNNPDWTPDFLLVGEATYPNRPIPFLWQNVNHLPKIIGPDGFNSNYFSTLWSLTGKYPEQTDKVLQNPFIYYATERLSESAFIRDTSGRVHGGITIFEDKNKMAFDRSELFEPLGYPEPLDFSANYSKFKVRSTEYSGTHCVNYLQSYYPGWRAYLDGDEIPIYQTNVMFMSVLVPEGEHILEFRYFNRTAFIAALISYATFFGLMVLMSVYYIRKRRQNALIVGVLWSFLFLSLIVYLVYFSSMVREVILLLLPADLEFKVTRKLLSAVNSPIKYSELPDLPLCKILKFDGLCLSKKLLRIN